MSVGSVIANQTVGGNAIEIDVEPKPPDPPPMFDEATRNRIAAQKAVDDPPASAGRMLAVAPIIRRQRS